MIAYYKTSNFASQYLVDIFKGFIILRAGLVILYALSTSILAAHKGSYIRADLRRKKYIEEKQEQEEQKQERQKRRRPRDDFGINQKKTAG